MTSVEIAQAEPARARPADTDSIIIRLVNSFPQDASDEAFAEELRMLHQAKQLRAACTQLGLNPQADPSTNSKDGYIKLLCQYRRAKLRGETFTGYGKTKQKRRATVTETRTKHCGFKLVNVILNPALLPRMIEAGTVQSTGNAEVASDGRNKYWRDVAEAYASDDPQNIRIVGLPGRYEGIDPGRAHHHTPPQLCAIWRDLTTKYQDSYSRWKQLGTEKVGFAHFCGDLAVLYLYDRLQMQSVQMETDPAQVRASKRARLGKSSETASIEAEEPRNIFFTPRVQGPAQRRVSRADGVQEPLQRQNNQNSGQVPPSTQLRDSTCSTSEVDFRVRRLLPKATPVRAPTPREDERIRTPQALGNGGHRENQYESVIHSSQAVRETMAAIDALKRGRFDHDVIAQAEESLDAIVQVWLRELDHAAQP
ncbi:hypothetical protein V7S43_013145 [Phytophthora oleae]|uniref:Uncharacterized protein n=1 Tax=Phytophthora oleae TaxID=2107226 RepID=A0ABD3F5T8_9STRA